MKKIFVLCIFSNLIFAHGENVLGPHGGYIRMPAMFHTELVINSNQEFLVYLMNVNNKESTTINSSVNISHSLLTSNKNTIKCSPISDYFKCVSNHPIDINKGQLIIKAKRNNEIGNDAIYELPLNLK